jgi:uncharacterized protein
MTVFVDANIPMYAAGSAHPAKKPCIAFLRKVAAGKMEAATDAEVFQEILHRFAAIERREDGFRLFDLFSRVMQVVLPIERQDVVAARNVLAQYGSLNARDAIHAAVMARRGIRRIYSYDAHFDGIAGIERKEP